MSAPLQGRGGEERPVQKTGASEEESGDATRDIRSRAACSYDSGLVAATLCGAMPMPMEMQRHPVGVGMSSGVQPLWAWQDERRTLQAEPTRLSRFNLPSPLKFYQYM
jgi:hypothetical protein